MNNSKKLYDKINKNNFKFVNNEIIDNTEYIKREVIFKILPFINNKIYHIYLQCYWIIYYFLNINDDDFNILLKNIRKINKDTTIYYIISPKINIHDIILIYIYLLKKINIDRINRILVLNGLDSSTIKKIILILIEIIKIKDFFIFIIKSNILIDDDTYYRNSISNIKKFDIHFKDSILIEPILIKNFKIFENFKKNIYNYIFHIINCKINEIFNEKDDESNSYNLFADELNIDDYTFFTDNLNINFICETCYFYNDIYCYKARSFLHLNEIFYEKDNFNIKYYNNFNNSKIYYNLPISITDNNSIMMFIYKCIINDSFVARYLFGKLCSDDINIIYDNLGNNLLLLILSNLNLSGIRYNHNIYYSINNNILYDKNDIYEKLYYFYGIKTIKDYHIDFIKDIQKKVDGSNVMIGGGSDISILLKRYESIKYRYNNIKQNLDINSKIKINNYYNKIKILIKESFTIDKILDAYKYAKDVGVDSILTADEAFVLMTHKNKLFKY